MNVGDEVTATSGCWNLCVWPDGQAASLSGAALKEGKNWRVVLVEGVLPCKKEAGLGSRPNNIMLMDVDGRILFTRREYCKPALRRMTFIEAVKKCGRSDRIKRKGWDAFFVPITIEDMNATDWELEGQAVQARLR